MDSVDKYRNLWVQKHRPPTIDGLVLDPRIRMEIESFTKDGAIPHMLLYGEPGGGKTSLAKIIVDDMLDCQCLYINASDETGVDVVRGKIKTFATRKAMNGKLKVVILDEVDGTKANANGTSMQKALRNVMETYADNVRFILTANHIGQIDDAILSRCTIYNIVPNITDYVKAVYNVLTSEDIVIGDVDAFVSDVKSRYPDIRKCLNYMQRACVTGEYVPLVANNEALRGVCSEIVRMIRECDDIFDLRQYIVSQGDVIANDYRAVMHIMFDLYFDSENHSICKKRDMMLIISDFLKSNEVVMDLEINFFSCCLMLSKYK